MTVTELSPDVVGMSANRLERIHPAIRAYVDGGGYVGISVAIARRGQVVFRAQYGDRDREAGLPMTDDTIFRIYSMTKPIVCVAVMALLEEGKIRLTNPVSDYLPAFAAGKVLGDDGILADPVRPVTVRDLLTHTSGLTNELQPNQVAALYREARLHHDATRSLASFVDEAARMPLAFQPGTRWHYGAGIDVAARLVEVIADQPFDQFLNERVLEPLGMTDTGFGVAAAKLDRLAAMYGLPDVFAKGVSLESIGEAAGAGFNERVDVSDTHPTDTPDVFVRGGFGLYSTLDDYLRFAQMLANHGELNGVRLLSRKTVELMYTNHLPPALLPFETFGEPNPGWGFGLGSASCSTSPPPQVPAQSVNTAGPERRTPTTGSTPKSNSSDSS